MTAPPVGRLVWLVAAAAVVSVGVAVSAMSQRMADRWERAAPVGEQTRPQATPVAIDAILALTPFGRPAGVEAPGYVPETAVSLTLHGVVRAVPASNSRAIISSDGAPALSYVVGNEITGGMRLIEVQGDHVVIETNGRREALSFVERRPALPAPDPVAAEAGVTGDIDALRALIFDQANSPPAAAD